MECWQEHLGGRRLLEGVEFDLLSAYSLSLELAPPEERSSRIRPATAMYRCKLSYARTYCTSIDATFP